MKNAIIFILTLCLGVSLWMNRQDRKEMRRELNRMQASLEMAQSHGGAPQDAASKTATATDPGSRGLVPKAPPSIDFSGTAFEDNSWKLDNKAKAAPSVGGLPTATQIDGDSQLGAIPEASGVQDTSPVGGQKKPGAFKSILTNPGN